MADVDITDASGELSPEQRIRIHALHEATAYVYGYNLISKSPTSPSRAILKARDVLNVAEVFRVYITTGETPDVAHVAVADINAILDFSVLGDDAKAVLEKAIEDRP